MTRSDVVAELASRMGRARCPHPMVTVARAEARESHRFGSTEQVRQPYADRHVPGQRQYLAEAQPERHASIGVDNNDATHPRLGGL